MKDGPERGLFFGNFFTFSSLFYEPPPIQAICSVNLKEIHMKFLGMILALSCSLSAFAAEKVVLEVSVKNIRASQLSTRFEVNLEEGTAGGSLTATRVISRGRRSRRVVKHYEALIPELSLNGDVLTFEGAEGSVDCGTMGVTRVFKRPVLNLSGNCSLVTKRVGKKVQLVLLTK